MRHCHGCDLVPTSNGNRATILAPHTRTYRTGMYPYRYVRMVMLCAPRLGFEGSGCAPSAGDKETQCVNEICVVYWCACILHTSSTSEQESTHPSES